MEPTINFNDIDKKIIVSIVSTLTGTLEMSSSIYMGVNGNNTKNWKDNTYKKTTNCRYKITTKIPVPVSIINELTYDISNHTSVKQYKKHFI